MPGPTRPIPAYEFSLSCLDGADAVAASSSSPPFKRRAVQQVSARPRPRKLLGVDDVRVTGSTSAASRGRPRACLSSPGPSSTPPASARRPAASVPPRRACSTTPRQGTRRPGRHCDRRRFLLECPCVQVRPQPGQPSWSAAVPGRGDGELRGARRLGLAHRARRTRAAAHRVRAGRRRVCCADRPRPGARRWPRKIGQESRPAIEVQHLLRTRRCPA